MDPGRATQDVTTTAEQRGVFHDRGGRRDGENHPRAADFSLTTDETHEGGKITVSLRASCGCETFKSLKSVLRDQLSLTTGDLTVAPTLFVFRVNRVKIQTVKGLSHCIGY